MEQNTQEAQNWLPQAAFQGDMSADDYGNNPRFHSTRYRDETEIMDQLGDASDANEVIQIIKSMQSLKDEYGLTQEPSGLNLGDIYVSTVEALTKGGEEDAYYPQYGDIAYAFAEMAYEADALLIIDKPAIDKADYIEYSRIKELMKHVHAINNNHIEMLKGSADDQYELNQDPEYSEYHASPESVDNTLEYLMEQAQVTLPVALGDAVMEALVKLKKDRGPLTNAEGRILF